MSGHAKGARRPKKDRIDDSISIGKYRLKYDVLIAILLAVFYALSLLAARLQGGLSAVMVSVIMFVSFVAFAYFVRMDAISGLRQLRSLIFVFIGLSMLSLAWELLLFFNFIDVSRIGTVTWIMAVGAVNAVASLSILAGILYFEKLSLNDLNVRPGDKINIAMGLVGFILCVILAVVATYVFFGGNAVGQATMVNAIAVVLAFGIFGGVFEEVWFRGLLMDRIGPILGGSNGNIYQAVVFAVFEAVMLYTVTFGAIDLTVLLIISAMMGYYWGRATMKTKSLWSPMLLHAGLYVLIMLPVIVGLLS
jgi:membrane protease YdiL (CAAX protease family)